MLKKMLAVFLMLAAVFAFAGCKEKPDTARSSTPSVNEKTEAPEYNSGTNGGNTGIGENTDKVTSGSSSKAEVHTSDNMSNKRENELRQNFMDYWNKANGSEYAPEDVIVIHCFYDSPICTVLLIEERYTGYDDIPLVVKERGYEFRFKTMWDVPKVYSGGVFFNFTDAIKNDKILTDDALETVYEKYQKDRPYFKDVRK